VVAAPSKLQRPAADRIKTDARDALLLARLLRMDELVEVRVPGIEQEAARVRAREDARSDLMRCRHRVSKLLLRHGIVYAGGHPWNGVRERWLRAQQFGQRGIQLAFDADLEAMLFTLDRRDRLDKAITEMATDGEYAAIVHRLGCLRGVSTLTAFGLAVEIGDWHRFTGATIGAYLGLVPTESSSGQQRSQGSITKAGNTHARRLLVEAAWHHRRDYRNPGAAMRARWNLASPAAKARGHAGNHRLHQRWRSFVARKKKTVIANVAVAPGAGRLVLVPGGPRRLTERTTREQPGGAGRTWQRVERPATVLRAATLCGATLALLDQRDAPAAQPVLHVTNPRISV
jgi:transposase